MSHVRVQDMRKKRDHLGERTLQVIALMAAMSPMEIEAVYLIVAKMALGQVHHGHAYKDKKNWTMESLGERTDDSVYNAFALVEEMAKSDKYLDSLITFTRNLNADTEAARAKKHGFEPTGGKGVRASCAGPSHKRKGRAKPKAGNGAGRK